MIRLRQSVCRLLNAIIISAYLFQLSVFTIIYVLCFPFLMLVLGVREKGQWDSCFRINNALYGGVVCLASWPYIRFKRRGAVLARGCAPCVVVTNHRHFADIFLFGLLPFYNIAVMVRTWPFSLFILGYFMRWGGYLDIEKNTLEELSETMAEYLRRGASFLFFPEAHRSRDAKLRRFQSGAFRTAAKHNLKVVPVCVTGMEQLKWPETGHLFRPIKIIVEIMPPVDPATFPAEKRALLTRRCVEGTFREYFGE